MIRNARGSNKETMLFIAIGIFAAITVNYGMSIVMATQYPIVAVESNSMSPFFYKGDILIIKGLTPQELKIGDVIVFSVTGRNVPIVHRLIEKNNDGTYQTKGDANSNQHEWEKRIEFRQIEGKQIFILPFLGWMKIGITEIILANILIIAVIVGLITFIYLVTNKKERN